MREHSEDVFQRYLPPPNLLRTPLTQHALVDTFSVSRADSKTPVGFNKHGITWAVERRQLFRQLERKFPGIYTVESVTDEDFIIWMRVAALPNFMKLYRVYDSKRPLQGKFVVHIKNSMCWR